VTSDGAADIEGLRRDRPGWRRSHAESAGSVTGASALRLTAKLTAKLDDTRGPQGMTMDAYTRPELRRREPRRPAEQLTSPGVEEPNGVGRSYVPWNYG
jgi:hypothetical protein